MYLHGNIRSKRRKLNNLQPTDGLMENFKIRKGFDGVVNEKIFTIAGESTNVK